MERTSLNDFWLSLRTLAPGLALAASIAIAAVLIEPLATDTAAFIFDFPVAIPALVLALVAGMAMHVTDPQSPVQPGLNFAVKKLLRVAIALLGLRIAFSDIAALGITTALIIMVSMTLTLLAGFVLARLVGRDDAFGALAGAATAVCGASAALATASVLPADKNRDADIVFTVVAVNALSTVAMLAYPPLCLWLGYDGRETAILLGATIHDVAQVVGAGYSVSPETGNGAVIVKLFRVFLLLPVVLAIGWYFTRKGAQHGNAKVPFPLFAVVFVALAALNSTGLVPPIVKSVLGEVSRWGLLIAIAALGIGTSLGAVLRIGWQAIVVICGTTLFLLAAVIAGLAIA
jgi:uncharacterized integral membrane protein (TIGR00698 family)